MIYRIIVPSILCILNSYAWQWYGSDIMYSDHDAPYHNVYIQHYIAIWCCLHIAHRAHKNASRTWNFIRMCLRICLFFNFVVYVLVFWWRLWNYKCSTQKKHVPATCGSMQCTRDRYHDADARYSRVPWKKSAIVQCKLLEIFPSVAEHYSRSACSQMCQHEL